MPAPTLAVCGKALGHQLMRVVARDYSSVLPRANVSALSGDRGLSGARFVVI
jgi:hypothetical protein